MLNNVDIDSFIDIGCGAGELACSLAEKGFKGVGSDFSISAIKTANKLKKDRNIKDSQLRFYIEDSKKIKTQKHDLVICCEVLEHIKDDRSLLKNLKKNSNKYLLLSVPAKQRLFDASDAAVGHFRRYEKDSFLELLNSEGLEVLSFATYGYPFTNLVRILRKILFRIKFSKNKSETMEDRSKESGINPVKLPSTLTCIDLETVLKPFYGFSLLFNRFNLSEGYLVLCKKKK